MINRIVVAMMQATNLKPDGESASRRGSGHAREQQQQEQDPQPYADGSADLAIGLGVIP